MHGVLQNYRTLLQWDLLTNGNLLMWVSQQYPRWFINSLFVAISTVLLGVFLDSLAAFAFAKYEFPLKRVLFALLIGTLMIPYPVTLVPTFFIFAKLHFYNTYAALIVPGIVSAFGIFLVRQYMENIPDDMLAAARVDGASDFQVYRRIVLPAARPVLAALAVFRFIYQWNTYLYPLVLTNKDSMKTLQLGIATMEDMHGTVDYGMQMAGSAVAVIPILIVYAFMQKHFIAGITMGSAKG
jgi:multiple sugar transport system permease protein